MKLYISVALKQIIFYGKNTNPENILHSKNKAVSLCLMETPLCSLLLPQHIPNLNLIPHCLILHMKGSVTIRISYVRKQYR